MVDKYVVMPNHVHIIITISHDGTAQGITEGAPPVADKATEVICKHELSGSDSEPQDHSEQRRFPTISSIIKQFKTITTKLYINGVKSGIFPPFNKKIWQKSFYDHIIHDENRYLAVWKYIDENTLKWYDDEYYEQ